jgi:hypothetical protein
MPNSEYRSGGGAGFYTWRHDPATFRLFRLQADPILDTRKISGLSGCF